METDAHFFFFYEITQDVRYLKPIVSEIEAELTERADWDSVKLDKSAKH